MNKYWWVGMMVSTLVSSWAVAGEGFGKNGQWNSGWAQGTSEYVAMVSAKNNLYIACSEDSLARMTLTLNGMEFEFGGANGPFDLIIDGKAFEAVGDTGSRMGSDDFRSMWDALRRAQSIQARVVRPKATLTLNLPVKEVAKALPVRKSREYGCRTTF